MSDKYIAPTLGIVADTNDPLQQGRLRIICPAWDAQQEIPVTQTEIEKISWANYASPFGGTIKNISAGPNKATSWGPTAYGFWAIPEVGAHVIVQCIDGDQNQRYWTHSVYPVQTNRSLPSGRGYDDQGKPGPWTDSNEKYDPGFDNLRTAGLSTGAHYKSRGGYERQVAQPKTDKDGSEGYAKNPSSGKGLNSQTYCLSTPGHHFLTLQDSPEFSRIRLKTAAGHQIIFDDTNERIYISTAKGNNYVELDQDGHIHVFSKESISVTTDKDFNVKANGSINMSAVKDVNIISKASVNITATADINISAKGSIFETATGSIHIKASGNLIEQGAQIHLNGPAASPAKLAIEPPIIPAHEPWVRPASPGPRGPNWSE